MKVELEEIISSLGMKGAKPLRKIVKCCAKSAIEQRVANEIGACRYFSEFRSNGLE